MPVTIDSPSEKKIQKILCTTFSTLCRILMRCCMPCHFSVSESPQEGQRGSSRCPPCSGAPGERVGRVHTLRSRDSAAAHLTIRQRGRRRLPPLRAVPPAGDPPRLALLARPGPRAGHGPDLSGVCLGPGGVQTDPGLRAGRVSERGSSWSPSPESGLCSASRERGLHVQGSRLQHATNILLIFF